MNKKDRCALILCSDGKWRKRAEELVSAEYGGVFVDTFTRPGGVRRHHHLCEFTKEVIRDISLISIGVNGSTEVDCVNHCLCGDYGGTMHSLTTQAQLHAADIRKAKPMLRQKVHTKLLKLSDLSDPELKQLFLGGIPPVPIVQIRRNIGRVLEQDFRVRGFWLGPSSLDLNTTPHPADCTLHEVED